MGAIASLMTLETWEIALLALLGLVAGILNVIAGGGSLITLPSMILMGIPEGLANGSNRLAILAQNVSAVSGFRKQGFSDFRLSLTLALASVPGAYVGARAGVAIRGELFNQILAGVMLVVILLMARRPLKPATAITNSEIPLSRARLFWGHIAMVGVGFYGGFIQAGVGFLLMAVLHKVLRLDLIRVNMHKVFIVGVFTAVAFVVFLSHEKVWWLLGISVAVGNSLGGWVGSHLTVSKGEVFVRRVLLVALFFMAMKLILG